MEETERTCEDCGESKPIEDFPPGSSGKYHRRRCRICHRKKAAKYRADHADQIRKKTQEWRDANREKLAPKQSAKHRATRVALKTAAMAAYGGRCSCCGVDDLIFLTVDHVDENGADHRRQIFGDSKYTAKTYRWLRDNDYPVGFQILCFNCNFAKHWGGCPHREGNNGLS